MITATFMAIAALTTLASPRPPLLDGRCDDAEWTVAPAVELGQGVSLQMIETRQSVFVCLRLPQDSYGTFDLYLQDAAGRRRNLHSSAQVGERQWQAGTWGELQLGRFADWYSPPVPLAAPAANVGQAPGAGFTPVATREMELRKSGFALSKPWTLMLEIRALGGDKRGKVRFPADSDPLDAKTWSLVASGGSRTAKASRLLGR